MSKDLDNDSKDKALAKTNGNGSGGDIIHEIVPVSGMYENWFLEYASYVILERAVPAIEDGLKPVQRRILHALNEMDDGRFNKVANIIGQTMQYHPHGDASIGDAMVNLGQKDLLIETQGNWGDIRTGDSAAAPRYIEARLSKFALDVVFNPNTTNWQLSYDGRKREPVTLPVKFPLLLAQGVEGIAVGLSTKILPHNFCELIEASIDVLKKKKINLYPDFPTGGMIDVANYNEGMRGGRVRIRAKIEEMDKKTLAIRDIPFGTTTTTLIDSIIKANDSGKIRIKKVVDNTARDVEIQIHLLPGVSPDITIDALYAFTDCETSISPNACVIIEDKPLFISINEALRISTKKTLDLLKLELEIRRGDLLEKLLFSSLEKIFIENRIYRNIEECETWEDVIKTIHKGLKPYKKQFYREITDEDVAQLTEIKIKRISRYDAFKADEQMRKLEEDLKETEHNLANLVDYAVRYFQNLLKKYGAGRERKTLIRTFETISATVVAAANAKLYVNREEGFIGYNLKKDEFVAECSDLDDVIVFRRDGKCVVKKIGEKVFAGKDIIHVAVFKKGDDRMVYNLIYLDGETGNSLVKRFQVMGITRDKEYDLTRGFKGSKVLYFSANPNAEAETVTVMLTTGSKAKVKVFDFDFSEVAIKGRMSQGNILTKHPVKKVQFKAAGVSTLGGIDVWYDEIVGRLNLEHRGVFLGKFEGEDRILVIYKDGTYEITSFETTNRYESASIMHISKLDCDAVISAVYLEGESKTYYVKRFKLETASMGKKFGFISEASGSKLAVVTTDPKPQIQIDFAKGKYITQPTEKIYLDEFIDVKGWKAIGNKLTTNKVTSIKLLETVPKEEKIFEETIENSLKELEVKDKAGLAAGTTIDLDPKKAGKEKKKDDQLGLF
ncbi:MAG TPA: DNA gyrase/topoisomerase IV subunit A [Cytophagaceae bacterium]|jgi:topoisomerase-4 subunit A